MSFDFGESAFELVADRKVKEAMDEGAFDNLPGKGKPLKLDEDWLVPAPLRAAFRIIKNANVLPDWMERSKQVDGLLAEAKRLEQTIGADYGFRKRKGGDSFRNWYADRMGKLWLLYKQAETEALNLTLTAPEGTANRMPFNGRKAMAAALERFPGPEGLDPEVWMAQAEQAQGRRRRPIE